MDEQELMQVAIACARSVEGRTSPRPSVGAVIAADGVVLATGATSPPYGPHAELHALQAAGQAAQGADLYTTLEPCCIMVHTPPCTEAIIRAGIKRVFVGALDPNPRVYAQGSAQLRAAGIEVITGIEEEACSELVRPFAILQALQRPYVTAKWAMTLDGKIATSAGDSRWISGAGSRLWVHNLRDRVDAILVGARTALVDDPQLTVRLTDEQRDHPRIPYLGPWRVVLSTDGQLPATLGLLQPDLVSRTCIIVGETCPHEQQAYLQALGSTVLPVTVTAQGVIDLKAALTALTHLGCMHVLLEGGSRLLGSAFNQQLIDHVAVFIAPRLLGDVDAPSPISGQRIAWMQDAQLLRNIKRQIIENDLLIEGDIIHGSEQ